MLEAIREHAQGWIAKVILALLIIPFALWGIDSYFSGDGKEKPAAAVNKVEISQREFREALQQQVEQLERQASNAKVDPGNKVLRTEVLGQLVNTQLLVEAAQAHGLVVTDMQVDQFLHAIPAFHDQTGKFSEESLARWLEKREMKRPQLIQMLRRDIMLRQLQAGYGEGAVMPIATAERISNILSQQREVQEVIFDIARYINGISIDAKAVDAEFKAHPEDYKMPARLRVEYLVLSTEALASSINISEAALNEFYVANAERYQEPEQRRASHILIKANAAMDAKARQSAKAKAEQVLREVRANPAGFADLARKYSDDPGSGAQGGSLGSFTREMMVKPFADAAFSMKAGEISGLVESEYGYHIIRVEGITPGRKLPLQDVRTEIQQELLAREAQRRFAEAADRFSNMVYEQPDSLAPAAKEFGLQVQQSDWISRGAAQPAFLGNSRLMDALFTPEALEKKQNTEAIEVAPNTLVAARVLEHRPEGQRPFAEVAGEIRLKLAAKAAREQAIKDGKAALQAAQAGQAPAGMSAPMPLSRMQPLNVPVEAVRAVFAAQAAKLPAFVGVETREGYRLYRINRVQANAVTPDQVRMAARDLQRLQGQEELRVYLEYLRGKAKIELNQELLEKKTE